MSLSACPRFSGVLARGGGNVARLCRRRARSTALPRCSRSAAEADPQPGARYAQAAYRASYCARDLGSARALIKQTRDLRQHLRRELPSARIHPSHPCPT